MKTSIATVSISGDLEEKLAAIAAAGFDGVEIFENDLLAFDAPPAEVGRMVRDQGLEITLFQPFRDFEGLPEPHRARAFDRAERKFDVMQELGTDLMLVCSSVSSISLGGIDRAAEDFRELGERAIRRGLRVGYEALAWGRHINDHRDAWEVVRRANHPAVGLVLDSFHTLARQIDVDSIRSIPKDRIFFVQLADAPAIPMDLLYWSRHFRNMPGEGDLPVDAFMRAVLATGYDGYLSLEIFNDHFRGGSARLIAEDGRRSLVNLVDRARRAEPGLGAVTMPDRAEVQGVEFIEFTARGADAETLADLLSRMGFAQIATHRSKSVDLYRQGDVNILINRGATGFAHSAYLRHGATVCALCFRLDSAADAMKRAAALGMTIHHEEVGPGELTIPAVRTVGEAVIHFVDRRSELERLWEVDFVPVGPRAARRSTGLVTVDHIGLTMPDDEVMSWQLFYTSLFRCAKQPMFDIVDPSGLLRGQVVENESGTLRMTLEGATNRRTFSGRFLAETLSSGVHHIALASSDILATAAALEANGLGSLPIPRNYYDDIEARFGLDPDFVERLRAANILYDRDEGGEFLQLYGPLFGPGLFFEIVERRDGYGGYGAANAPFRIAAQRRLLRRSEPL
jgi:4-hydroxyphenylpyruvate dioxygenase